MHVQYLTHRDASSGFHKHNTRQKSSYLTTFAYKFGRYTYVRMLLRSASAVNKFQKIDWIFKKLTNVSGIVDDILILGYNGNGTDHYNTVM